MGCFSFLIMSLLLAFIWNHVKALSISVKCFMVPFLANGVSGAFYFHENCFLLGTIAKCHLHGSDLLVQQHFRWVQLRWDGEPMRGLLQRILRRKVINKVRTQISFSSYINHLVCLSIYDGNAKGRADNFSCFRKTRHSVLGRCRLCMWK